MAYDSVRAAKGQAINLAVADALKNNLENNPKYIYKKFLYYEKLAEVLQGSDKDMILDIVGRDFESVIQLLSEEK